MFVNLENTSHVLNTPFIFPYCPGWKSTFDLHFFFFVLLSSYFKSFDHLFIDFLVFFLSSWMIFLYNKCIIYLSVLLTALFFFFTVCCLHFSLGLLKTCIKVFFSYGVKWVGYFSSIFPKRQKCQTLSQLQLFQKSSSEKFENIVRHSNHRVGNKIMILYKSVLFF